MRKPGVLAEADRFGTGSIFGWGRRIELGQNAAKLIYTGIIQGNGPEVLSQKAQMTRAEVAALIARMLKVTDLIDK
ncbi:hypothetical protein [Marinicrinis lubricantis]|uniref:SLH domain-containing protein n=1 Tax=Marinicrinis lubricantis TaxID=2086470 RepID=A0ABW1IV83_9BACL